MTQPTWPWVDVDFWVKDLNDYWKVGNLRWDQPSQKCFCRMKLYSRPLCEVLKILECLLGEDRTFMSWSADRTHSELNKNFLKTYNRSSTKCKYLGSSKGGQKPDNAISLEEGAAWALGPSHLPTESPPSDLEQSEENLFGLRDIRYS